MNRPSEDTTDPMEQNSLASRTSIEAVNEDWEEWDGRSPFWIHCVAGSLAGVTEVSFSLFQKILS
jgi:predicted protein tyrosine phosphatase